MLSATFNVANRLEERPRDAYRGRLAMPEAITSAHIEAYSHCPRKAFLLRTEATTTADPHPYASYIQEQADANRRAHLARLAEAGEVARYSGPADLDAGWGVISEVELKVGDLHAHVDFLSKVEGATQRARHSHEPVRVLGTQGASKADAVCCAFQGFVLGEVQGRPPAHATLVGAGGPVRKIPLAGQHKAVGQAVAAMRGWSENSTHEPPPVVLNKHCPLCPYRAACLQQAENDDSLSLLDRMTPKLMQKYHAKGIFTVRQLSHLYKPRRARKNARRPVRHSLELQALAIRTGKVYVEHLCPPPRSPVELVVDLEGIPDRAEYYLAGVLVCRGDVTEYEAYWADDSSAEAAMWSALVERLSAFPDAPVYHYGRYDKNAFATLAKRHGCGGEVAGRLVNLATFVYGKVYFPVRSNGLKSVGRFLGATWTDPQASGLQSLVWRHRWEATQEAGHKESLLRYNREDCEAVRVLVARLTRIQEAAVTDPEVDFANRPKQTATTIGRTVHHQFERILRLATEDGQHKSVRVRPGDTEAGPKKRGAREGHQTYHRVIPAKVGRVIRVAAKRQCPKGHGVLDLDDQVRSERTVIDLAFTRSGCRKTTTRYSGTKGFCRKCNRHFEPPALKRLGNHLFGHAFQAWSVYQRVILRLPYRIIAQVTEHLFGVGLSASSGVNFLRYLAEYYAPTAAANLRAILSGGFVHVDETKISIQGVDHYVWVFTDGQHVAFRMTESREADTVREVLAGYQGVLVTDFYPGYDGVPCRQQKCLVHLIRDINDDLWKAPLDEELEAFAEEVRGLLVPMLGAVDRFGLKARHLRKYGKEVERFYLRNVAGREYRSELTEKYRKRFDRYRDSLFTFLSGDGIPWENNMAERAIRQLAVQRKISGAFYQRSVGHYLLLLALSQTCRFQRKSFLKFMLSRETDLASFRQARPLRYSRAVGEPRVKPEAAPEGSGSGPTDPEGSRSDPSVNHASVVESGRTSDTPTG